MKKKLLLRLLMSAKYTSIGFFIQCLIFSFVMASNTSAQKILSVKEVVLELEFKNSSLQEVFSRVESLTNYEFVYHENDLETGIKFNLPKRKISVADLLLRISEEANMAFKQQNQSISVKKLAGRKYREKDALEIVIQSRSINGKVTSSEDGEPLPGVNVIEKGTSNGSVTDLDGNYAITVSEGATLVFSSVGYVSQEVSIGSRSVIDLALAPDIKQLQELVVIGYGTQKRSDLTGSIASVDMDEVSKVATNNITKALQGQVAGVTVQSSGEPGATPRVKIRGIGSFTNNDPLYVVDGVFAPINDIPMSSIESIQVLKDASAAAIYGSRAANGVIIITTKRGESGRMRVDYNGYYGVQDITQRYDVANREQYQTLVNEATLNAQYFEPSLEIMPANDPGSEFFVDDTDTDWQDEVFKTGQITDHTISVSGGSEFSNFNVSLNYFDQTATVVGRGPDYTRYGISVNSDHTVGKFKFGESVHYTYADQTLMTFVHTGTMLNYTVNAIPTIPVFDESTIDGYGSADADIHNGYTANVIGMNNLLESETDRYRFIGNLYGQYEIIPDLNYKISVSFERTDWRDFHFDPVHDLGWFYVNNIAKMDDNRGYGLTGTFEQTLNYDKSFGKLNMTALLGQSSLNTQLRRTYGHAETFTTPYYKQLSNGETTNVRSDEFQSRLLSYFGRLILSFDDKYLLTGTFRRDGSSRFSAANRWGNFPSVAVAWKVHNESFMEPVADVVSQLKLRGSYGILGNQNIGDYLYQATITPYAHYVLNGQLASGAASYLPFSDDIKWEQAISTNAGIDLGLLNNRILINADYYIRKVDDMLYAIPVPTHLGFYDWESPTVNGLSVKNSGIEVAVSYNNTQGDFTYSIGANMSTLKNEVLSLGYGTNPINGIMSRTDVGREVGEFYGWVVEDIFQEQSEIDELNATSPTGYYQEVTTRPGDFKFVDLSGDGKIDENDRTYLGSAFPDLNYGFNISAGYKGFDLSILAHGVSGNMVNNTIRRGIESGAGWDNYATALLDRWTPDNRNTGRPRIVLRDPNNNGRDSDFWLEDGSYLKISNIELGYSLPASLIESVNITSLRLYVSAQNALTFTKYTGFDPDFNNDGLFNRGTDQGAEANKPFTAFSGGLPTPRTILFGVKAGF